MMTEIKRLAFHNLLRDLSGPIKFNEAMRTLYAFSRMNTPPFLYRYRRCGGKHSFDDIEKGLITLSSASRFDDPDDTAIHDMGELDKFAEILSTQNDIPLQKIKEMSSTVKKRGSEDKWSQLLGFANEFFCRPEKVRRENLEHLKKQIRSAINLEELNRHLRSRQKIACFCENSRSSYMWKNFADDGAGYLIEYDTSKLYSIDASHNRVPHILPVVYHDESIDTFLLPILSGISDISEMMIDDEMLDGWIALGLISTIFYKRRDPFSKEEEWRLMLAPLDTEIDDEFIFRHLRPTRLIAGSSMSSNDKKRLYDCVDNNNIMIMECGETFDDAVKRMTKSRTSRH